MPLSLRFASARIEEQAATILSPLAEVKQLADRACDSIKRSLTDALTIEPVIFDEPDDRTLISYGVIHEVFFRPRRNHQQRQTRTVTAAAEGVRVAGVKAGERSRRRATSARSSESVGWSGGGVKDWSHLVVVPSVGVVIHDQHSCTLPTPLLFEEVDGVDDEGLLIQGIGIPRVAVLIRRSLEEAHCREVSSGDRSEEVLDVVLVVGWSVIADFRDGSRTRMLRIAGRSAVTEK